MVFSPPPPLRRKSAAQLETASHTNRKFKFKNTPTVAFRLRLCVLKQIPLLSLCLPVASCRLSCQLLENHARQKASCHVLIIYTSPSICHTPKSPTMSANNRIKITNSKTMEVDVDVEHEKKKQEKGW